MTKNQKKQLGYTVTFLLSLGAGLTLGLLSFGGIYAIYPSISLGISSFLLASLYEGQIYFQNISEAIKKLFDPNHFDNELSNDIIESVLDDKKQQLIAHIEERYKEELDNLTSEQEKNAFIKEKISINKEYLKGLPQFFSDFKNARDYLVFISESLPNSKEEDKAKKQLELMKHYFYKTLNGTLKQTHPYAIALKEFISNDENKEAFLKRVTETNTKKKLIKAGVYFSLITSALFSVGSVYLILETLATLSFITLPLPAILGMSLVCGVAYGYLTFNSLSDMIWNESLTQWYEEVKSSIDDAITNKQNIGKALALGLGSILLVSLATCLTIFTAGTWWTIAQELKNLPNIIKKIPNYVTKVLIPGISATATLIFTLENTKNSLDQILSLLANFFSKSNNFFAEKYTNTRLFFSNFSKLQAPLYQKLNPFNFLIYCIETPLKLIGFTAHIGSVAVTTSRIPHVPVWLTVVLAFLSELFEDLHYFFFGNKEEGCKGHDHSNDIPSKFITLLLSPLHVLSYAWHSKGTRWFTKPKDFFNTWQEQKTPQLRQQKDDIEEPVSTQWQQQKILMQLDAKIDQLNITSPLAQEKRSELIKLKDTISNIDIEQEKNKKQLLTNSGLIIAKKIRKKMKKILNQATPKLSQHRNFWDISGKTASQELKESLSEEIDQLPDAGKGFNPPFV